MKNSLFFMLFICFITPSCDNETELNKYFLGEKFTVTSGEPAIVVDTSDLFLNPEDNNLVFTEYYIELKSLIIEGRCAPASCSSCFGGVVEIKCEVSTNNPDIEDVTGIVEYPSCIEDDLELHSGAITTVTIDEIKFYCNSILPSYVENGELKDYFVKFIGIKQ